MEVLPGAAVVIVALIWLWLREPKKQVTSGSVQREGADAPSPRATEGHSGHLELAWLEPTAADDTPGLQARDPATGEPIDEGRARLESQPYEVLDAVDVEPAPLRRGELEPGVVLLVERSVQEPEGGVELQTADAGETIGRVAPPRGRHIAGLLDEGHRLESMVLRQPKAQTEAVERNLEVLVAERGVLPPVPHKSDARDSG